VAEVSSGRKGRFDRERAGGSRPVRSRIGRGADHRAGVLMTVPVMLSVAAFCNRTRHGSPGPAPVEEVPCPTS